MVEDTSTKDSSNVYAARAYEVRQHCDWRADGLKQVSADRLARVKFHVCVVQRCPTPRPAAHIVEEGFTQPMENAPQGKQTDSHTVPIRLESVGCGFGRAS